MPVFMGKETGYKLTHLCLEIVTNWRSALAPDCTGRRCAAVLASLRLPNNSQPEVWEMATAVNANDIGPYIQMLLAD